MEEITSQEWVKSSAVILAISGIFNRTQIKYGDRGYRYILLEAGHMAQNIYLLSAALGLKCCAIGGYIDDKINRLIDFDDQQEAVLYMLSLGS